MLEPDGARVLLLGVPNAGSYTPMEVLSGDETFGGVLQGLGNPLQEQQTRQILAGFPGFIQLQAGLTDPKLALGKQATWQALADQDLARVRERSTWHSAPEQVAAYAWGVPSAEILARAVELRKELDARADAGAARHAGKILTVVGAARSTPAGFENDGDGFVFRNVVDGGDGYVTTDSAMLPGARAWTLAAEHRSLTTTKAAYSAYEDLLETGDTRALPRLAAGGARGAASAPTY